MSREWVSAELEAVRPVPLWGTFTPVGLLTSQAWGLRAQATGFLVHPRVILTAAHAVTFPSEHERVVAGRIYVDLGSLRAWADAVALAAGYFRSQGTDGSADVAALRLPWAVCAPEDVVSLSSSSAEPAMPARLWGWDDGALRSHDLTADPVEGRVRYPAPNLPGFSGGPVVTPPGSPSTGHALGIHRAFHAEQGQGEAVPISFSDAVAAMEALGFIF